MRALRHWLTRAVLTVTLVLGTHAPVLAQQVASLVADRVQVIGNNQIVAEGNVVVMFGDARLTASRIVFDDTTGELTISGPITLDDGQTTVLIAETAQLSADLKNGILQSARLVLNQQLQIAAAEINRVQGRYTQAVKVVASSCQVCADRPVPLWAIRASRVIHDQQERQLYFHDAQLRVMDIPVFYLPRLRLPDPTQTRATGFLPPRLRSNSQIGTGVRVPYFIRIGDHADVTIAPFISGVTRTFETRYRHLFRSGGIEFNGAISQDTLVPGETRFYLFGSGAFDLPLGFDLDFQIEQVSDPAYLYDYGYADRDRLRNSVHVSRTRRDQYVFAELGAWETLRDSELLIADQLPFAYGDLLFEQRFEPGLLGGEAIAQVTAHGHYRDSNANAVGRDVGRTGAALSWRRDWVFAGGFVATAAAEFAADNYWVRQDAAFDDRSLRLTHAVAASLSWPLSRTAGNGAVDVVEPMLQITWAGDNGAVVPNEDSVIAEFDEANLFDLSRFPGQDRYETGLTGTAGLRWTRHNPNGVSFSVVGGRVFRMDDPGSFTAASGLDGTRSDWLIAGQAQLGSRLFAQGRLLLADDFSVTRSESLIGWQAGKLDLTAGHLWIIADPAENRPDPTHEWTLDTTYRFDEVWQASFSTHFDAVEGEPTAASFGLQYRNECITVDLSLSRRFTSSTNVTPATDVGFGITLTGFGNGASGPSRKCSS